MRRREFGGDDYVQFCEFLVELVERKFIEGIFSFQYKAVFVGKGTVT